jgi:hypothetical protein
MTTSFLYTAIGAVLGASIELAMIKSGFYDHMRLYESRRRQEELESMDAAVNRLNQRYPNENYMERWEIIKKVSLYCANLTVNVSKKRVAHFLR